MEFLVHWFDVSESLQTGVQPALVVKRPVGAGANASAAGRFWVPNSSVFVEPVDWVLSSQSDYVRIPILAYDCEDSLPHLEGTGAQFGLAAALSVQAVAGAPVELAVLVLGQITKVPPQVLRSYIGLALKTR